MITRNNAEALIPTQVMNQIIQGTIENSVAMRLFKRLPNVTSDKLRIPVLDMLPITYWVDEKKNGGRKGVTKAAWDNKYLEIAELATIVVVKENVLNDATYDIWGEILPRIVENMGKKFDAAVFLGEDRPNGYPADIVSQIINAGALIEQGQSQSLYSAINDAMEKVEESGYEVNGIIGGVDLKAKFRMMLDSIGQPINGTEIGNLPKNYVKNGAWDKTKALLILGDMSEAVYAIRQDVTYKILTEGVIQNPETGDIMNNLAQDDEVAIRVVMRLGFAIPNPINALSPDASKRFPFAAIKGTEGVITQDVVFTVTDGNDDPVEGVKISLDGVIGYTDASGEATLKAQAGKYNYTAKKEDHKAKGAVTVASSSVSVNITNF